MKKVHALTVVSNWPKLGVRNCLLSCHLLNCWTNFVNKLVNLCFSYHLIVVQLIMYNKKVWKCRVRSKKLIIASTKNCPLLLTTFPKMLSNEGFRAWKRPSLLWTKSGRSFSGSVPKVPGSEILPPWASYNLLALSAWGTAWDGTAVVS